MVNLRIKILCCSIYKRLYICVCLFLLNHSVAVFSLSLSRFLSGFVFVLTSDYVVCLFHFRWNLVTVGFGCLNTAFLYGCMILSVIRFV